MSRICSGNTSIEIKVRKDLFRRGFRYRVNVQSLPGKPDIVLPKYRTAIFIHRCFWHHHGGCKYAATPSSNVEFWKSKFERNVKNDLQHTKDLQTLGWHVITIWECEIKHKFNELLDQIEAEIKHYSCQSSKEGVTKFNDNPDFVKIAIFSQKRKCDANRRCAFFFSLS